jgi:hypothetical protein
MVAGELVTPNTAVTRPPVTAGPIWRNEMLLPTLIGNAQSLPQLGLLEPDNVFAEALSAMRTPTTTAKLRGPLMTLTAVPTSLWQLDFL